MISDLEKLIIKLKQLQVTTPKATVSVYDKTKDFCYAIDSITKVEDDVFIEVRSF